MGIKPNVMKRTILSVFAFLFLTSILFPSCDNSIESDAKKAASLACKAQKMAMQAASGDMSVVEESAKLANEAAKLAQEMQGKYESAADAQKFMEAYQKALADCN
jgi:hypothetical protein